MTRPAPGRRGTSGPASARVREGEPPRWRRCSEGPATGPSPESWGCSGPDPLEIAHLERLIARKDYPGVAGIAPEFTEAHRRCWHGNEQCRR